MATKYNNNNNNWAPMHARSAARAAPICLARSRHSLHVSSCCTWIEYMVMPLGTTKDGLIYLFHRNIRKVSTTTRTTSVIMIKIQLYLKSIITLKEKTESCVTAAQVTIIVISFYKICQDDLRRHHS